MCQGLNFDSCERYDSTFIFLLISITLETLSYVYVRVVEAMLMSYRNYADELVIINTVDVIYLNFTYI